MRRCTTNSLPVMPAPTLAETREGAAAVLEAAWDDFRGYSFPHQQVYAHLWLWDSCFHSIAWAALGDRRAVRELEAVFAAQLPSGFVPHMRYAEPSMYRGPLTYASGYTQPAVYGHARAAGAARTQTPCQPCDRRIGVPLERATGLHGSITLGRRALTTRLGGMRGSDPPSGTDRCGRRSTSKP